mmetsp:Transcript_2620/g.6592  ORF Transcript_2620/g.6592 Transcript_2620/m.6592 type:complete len:238 (-) Transcript_2620:1660-2373(-)
MRCDGTNSRCRGRVASRCGRDFWRTIGASSGRLAMVRMASALAVWLQVTRNRVRVAWLQLQMRCTPTLAIVRTSTCSDHRRLRVLCNGLLRISGDGVTNATCHCTCYAHTRSAGASAWTMERTNRVDLSCHARHATRCLKARLWMCVFLLVSRMPRRVFGIVESSSLSMLRRIASSFALRMILLQRRRWWQIQLHRMLRKWRRRHLNQASRTIRKSKTTRARRLRTKTLQLPRATVA